MKLWAWLAYSERTTWKKPPCQQSACWCKLARRYDTSTSLLWWLHTIPSKIGLDCIVNHPGLIWSYWSITVLLPPHQFAPTALFLASKQFSSCSFWICQPIPKFHKFSFCDIVTSPLYLSKDISVFPVNVLFLPSPC